MLDEATFGAHVGQVVRAAVLKATEPLNEQIALLKAAQESQAAALREIMSRPAPTLEKGDKGDDGKSVTLEDALPVLNEAAARWALDYERHAGELLQRAVDRLPKPKDGEDGRHGLDLKDLDVSLDEDGRTFIFRMADEVQQKEWRLTPPLVLDQGVFVETKSYAKGDGVTWGGSFFVAQKAEPEGKPGESADWRLVVKRGRDAK